MDSLHNNLHELLERGSFSNYRRDKYSEQKLRKNSCAYFALGTISLQSLKDFLDIET